MSLSFPNGHTYTKKLGIKIKWNLNYRYRPISKVATAKIKTHITSVSTSQLTTITIINIQIITENT